MGRLKTMVELEKLQAEILKKRNPETSCVTVCLGTGCQAYNSRAVYDAFVKEINTRNLTEKIHLKGTGCHGFCEQGPVVVIFPSEIFYRRVKPEDVPESLPIPCSVASSSTSCFTRIPSAAKNTPGNQKFPFTVTSADHFSARTCSSIPAILTITSPLGVTKISPKRSLR